MFAFYHLSHSASLQKILIFLMEPNLIFKILYFCISFNASLLQDQEDTNLCYSQETYFFALHT
jgi:hypothetical protein